MALKLTSTYNGNPHDTVSHLRLTQWFLRDGDWQIAYGHLQSKPPGKCYLFAVSEKHMNLSLLFQNYDNIFALKNGSHLTKYMLHTTTH